MKKFLLLLSTCIVVGSTKAQTVHYFNKTVEHRATSDSAAWAVTSPAKGQIKIDSGVIIISPVGPLGKIMVVIHRGNWEPYDEGYSLREFVVGELTGARSMSVYSVLVLRNARKQITDITLKLNDKQVSYQILPYKPGEYGYKSMHATIKRD